MTTSKKTQSALRATLKQEDAAMAERLPAVASTAAAGETSAPAPKAARPAPATPRSGGRTKAAAAVRPAAEQAAPTKVAPGKAKPAKAVTKASAGKTSAKPAAAKPAARKATVTKPEASKPAASKPPAPKPVAAKPVVGGPSSAQSAGPEPGLQGAAVVVVDKVVVAPVVPRVAGGPARAPKKSKAVKMVRDSFSIPKNEQAELKNLRNVLARAGRPATKSEMLRAGLRLLSQRSVSELLAVLDALAVVAKDKGKGKGKGKDKK